jgi:carboxylesterase type B
MMRGIGRQSVGEVPVALNNETVRVESGLLSGGVGADGIVRSFKGMPYAKPTTGKLRWRSPEPPDFESSEQMLLN